MNIPLLRALSMALVLHAGAASTASAFELVDTHGATHSAAAHPGKWIVVNVWATWCAPCLQEMPELDALARAHDRVVVLGLAADGQAAARVAQFAEKLHVGYPVIAGDDAAARQFKVRGFPTTLLYDDAGRQVFLKEGQVTRAELERVLQAHGVD
ncbi:TlpA family protein disulfide reductase [Oxalobacteraceae bacterium OM1]|nr:TlpA family protein disulfide reductase [Oxalobacteraceae bacterium OM1]